MRLKWVIPLLFISSVGMAASVTSNATTCVNETSTGTVAWTSPSNGAVQDGSYATATTGAGVVSNFLTCSGFSFSLPPNTAISGIELIQNIDNPSSAQAADATLIMVINNSTSTNKAGEKDWNFTNRTIGSPTDTWGFSLTSNNLTNVLVKQATKKAGGVGSAEADIDSMSLRIYYPAPRQGFDDHDFF